ncbi:MAG: Hsp20/alpha crystallin family protein [Planctomycetota bacterium]|nr:MAG: Hsp20/alpha crystallin family protein [Planctomycetota bacterium]
MKMIPWKKSSDEAVSSDFDDFVTRALEPLDWGVRNRLAGMFPARNFPAMNVAETPEHYIVTLELPGLEPKDVNVELMGNTLQISGERRWEEEKKDKDYHRVESQYGSFARSVVLPDNLHVDREAVEATFQNGVLEIRVPKAEPTPAAKIPVKSK